MKSPELKNPGQKTVQPDEESFKLRMVKKEESDLQLGEEMMDGVIKQGGWDGVNRRDLTWSEVWPHQYWGTQRDNQFPNEQHGSQIQAFLRENHNNQLHSSLAGSLQTQSAIIAPARFCEGLLPYRGRCWLMFLNI